MRDATWFDAQWRTATRDVDGVCYKLAPRNEVGDCINRTMERAWNARATFIEGNNFSAWACRIAARVCIDAMRKWGRMISHFDEREWDGESIDGYSVAETTAAPIDVHAEVESREFTRSLVSAINQIPVAHRGIIQGLAEGATYEELADLHRIPVGTVRSRVHRARRRLREALAA